jgi:hypothetical protein
MPQEEPCEEYATYDPQPGSSWDDEPTPQAWDDQDRTTGDQLPQTVLVTVQRVLAAQHGQQTRRMLEVISNIEASTEVLDLLGDDTRTAVLNLVEGLAGIASNAPNGAMDMFDLPGVEQLYDGAVINLLSQVRAHVGQHADDGDPTAMWRAMVEKAQRVASRVGALQLAEAINARAPVAELIELHDAVPLPTRIGSTSKRGDEPLMVDEWELELSRIEAASPLPRISSGYFSLDKSATTPRDTVSGREVQQLGSFMPGDLHMKAAGTGQGKSSDASTAIPAAAQDLVNHGYPDGIVLLVHTEEEVSTKLTEMQLREGMRNRHLARNIAIQKVGPSLRRTAETLYKCVALASKRAQGGDVTPYLPYVMYVDYIQAIKTHKDNLSEAEQVAEVANYFLYGVCAWDFEVMADISGVSYESFIGMAPPDGMENHRVAVVVYAQLKKQEGERQFYNPSNKRVSIMEFCVEDNNGDPAWEVRRGDLRIPTPDEIRGGGQLLNHMALAIFLHRSRPHQSLLYHLDTGIPYLGDPRARFIIAKARVAQSMPYIPMHFSSNPNPGVKKGQYFDVLGELAMQQGRFAPDESWQHSGDFILPRRLSAASRPLVTY